MSGRTTHGEDAGARVSPRWEAVVAGLLSALVTALHGVRLLDAGGLWRDEAAAARLATLPTLREVSGLFQHEAFPLLFPLTLRAYSFLVGGGDRALRGFGLAVGLSLAGLLWWNARTTARTVPLLSLAFLGLDLPFLVYGDSVRGYGLGSALLLLTYGLLARALATPDRGPSSFFVRLAPLVLAAVASVQVLLSNAALLFALCAAAAGVAALRRRWGWATGIVASGAVAALSLLPYVKPLAEARRQWSFIVVYPTSPSRIFHSFAATLGPTPVRLLWLLILTVGLWGFARQRQRRPAIAPGPALGSAPGPADIALFAALSIPCALIANGIFLEVLGYTPRPWYFLPLLALLGSALDTLFGFLVQTSGTPNAYIRLRLAAVLLVAGAQAVPLAQGAVRPQTDVDQVARHLARSAAPQDLVVVDPWFHGVSFNRYYRGAARWLTLPDLADHRIHRYDLLKVRMAADHPIDDVLAAVAATLRSGHRVWRVSDVPWPLPGEAVPVLPPAPHSKAGWHDRPYVIAWSLALAAFLDCHAARAADVADIADIAVPAEGAANGLEDLSLVVAEGWRERPCQPGPVQPGPSPGSGELGRAAVPASR